MKREDFNVKLREYSRQHLSPTQTERDLIARIYESINDLLGDNNCIQIGSYPRFTAINPVHDLDVLYIIGEWEENNHNPVETLQNLYNLILEEYKNYISLSFEVSLQSHSVNIEYTEKNFSVDIVPAYVFGRNEFGDDMYKIPIVVKEKKHEIRKTVVWNSDNLNEWDDTDPRGYTRLATIAGENQDFRKAVKFVKKWKRNLQEDDPALKFKSFHLEQVITNYFLENPSLDLFGGIFKIFCELKSIVEVGPKIRDRANSLKYIDDYLEDFTEEQKLKIIAARDYLLIAFEEFKEEDSVSKLLEIGYRFRKSDTEEYLFDKEIPVLTEGVITIEGWIQKNGADFRLLNSCGAIDMNVFIRFCIGMGIAGSLYKWKVKNEDKCDQPRGEICDNTTLHGGQEKAVYPGNHYVECFAIINNICIAKARQNVRILK